MATSPDFVNWQLAASYDALARLPKWTSSPAHIWAPDVSRLDDGSYIMYFAALTKTVAPTAGIKVHCLGAARSDNVTGPYTPFDEPLVCDMDIGGAIDPDGFYDPVTNARYVVYKVDGNSLGGSKGTCSANVAPTPLRLQKVGDDGITLIGGSTDLLMNTDFDGAYIEGPSLFYRDGSHYLVYNSNCHTTKSYILRYAVSRHGVLGPYRKSSRPLVKSGQRVQQTIMQAPGGFDINPQDLSQIVFHADLNLDWFQNRGLRRARGLFTARLEFEEKTLLNVRTPP